MLKPRPAGNSGGIEPVGFDLQQLFVEALKLLRRDRTGKKIASDRVAQQTARFFEFGDASVKPFQRETLRLNFVFLFELEQKLFERRGVEPKIKRQKIRIRQPERDNSPDPRQCDMVFERGISDVRHPIM